MVVHWDFFRRIDNKPVDKTLSQGRQAAVANILAIFVEVSLLGGIGIAYNQILWRLLRKKALQARVIDKLVHLSGSPWDLVHWRVVRHLWHIKRVWVIGLLCAAIPFAAVFPPGAVSTEFGNQLPKTLHNVKTMNISDYGNGTIRQLVEHSLFELNGDLNYNQAWARPKLKAMAAQVLASGEPVKFDSPCGSACTYNISFEGPSFHCQEPEKKPKNCGPIYVAEDMVTYGADGVTYALVNNAFKITWNSNPKPGPGCDVKAFRSLVCSMKLSIYTLEIAHSLDASRSIKTRVHNTRDVWTDKAWIQSQFYYYFYVDDKEVPQPTMVDELHTNFTKSQAFAIRQGAISALQGQVILSGEAGAWSFEGNASQILGSPYIGLDDKYNPEFKISAGSIERFLQDVVISTLSLGTSTHDGDIEALVGTEIYVFNEKLQFYLPYGLCLFVAFVINAYGVWCWRRNGSTAGDSFLQFVTTTGSDRTLNGLAAKYPGGDENVPKELRELKLQFVERSFLAR
ncbi:hypothetical protein ACHAPT_006441 [Fusarium lateritium]